MGRRASTLALVGLAAGAAANCKKPAPLPPPRIVDVRVVDKHSAAGLPLDLAALTARATEIIGASGGLPVTDGGAGCAGAPDRCYRLRVEVTGESAEDASSGKGILRAMVSAELRPDGRGHVVEQRALAEKEYTVGKLGDPAAAWRAHTLRAVSDVVAGVGARLKLQRGDDRALAQAIEGADDDLRDEGISLAADRRQAGAVPSLIKLLKSEDHAVRDAAIGALAAIGDPRAVKPLTEVARFRDLSDLPKVLDALALVGGDEARAYLEFVASGHDNQEIRDLAKEALGHLDERQKRNLSTAAAPR